MYAIRSYYAATIEVETNEPLQAVADAVSVNMDESVRANLLSNDKGLTARTTIEVPAQSLMGGTLTVNADQTVTYTPRAGYSGSDSFSYTLCTDDTQTTCSTASVSVTVINTVLTNAPPLAIADVNLGWPNTSLQGNVLTNDLFYDPAKVQLSVVTIPEASAGKLRNNFV